ncbi:MAG: hypothetical protein ACRDN0_29500 [Trebonia sp.]
MTPGSAGQDRPGAGGTRWYRHGGGRLHATLEISFLSVFSSWLFVYGIGNPVRWALLVPGAVLAVALAAVAVLPMRAGIGVTPRHILIRAATGGTTLVPWPQVTRFEAAKGGSRSRGMALSSCSLPTDADCTLWAMAPRATRRRKSGGCSVRWKMSVSPGYPARPALSQLSHHRRAAGKGVLRRSGPA